MFALGFPSSSVTEIDICAHDMYLLSSPAIKLSPKKWGSSSPIIPIATFAFLSFVYEQGIDILPSLTLFLGLAAVDAILLGGVTFSSVRSMWRPHQRRVFVHEAGHILAG